MSQRSYREGRAKVTDEIKRTVSQLVEQEKDWENKKKHPSRWYRNKAAKILRLDENNNPSLRSYEELCRATRKNARVQNPVDKLWNSALLDNEPLDSNIIPWVINSQYNLKKYLSRPLTIREVKWFSRLFGFRKYIKPLPEIENNVNLKSFFISNVLVTWSQVYADRERINLVAGVQGQDYSDLDIAIVDNNIRLAVTVIDEKMIDRTLRMKASKAEIPEREYLVYIESEYLQHSLGEPDMPYESCHAYNIMMAYAKAKYDDKLRVTPYMQKVNFFILMRQFCIDSSLDQVIDLTMSDNPWWEHAFSESQMEKRYPLHNIRFIDDTKE